MILVGTPCYNGMVTVPYMVSLFNMTRTLANEGVHVDIMNPSHESLITRARNFIANEFLRQEEYSHLLFIDSDIGFPPDTASRYLRADKDIVCGIYPLKNLNLHTLRAMPKQITDKEAEAASLNYTVRVKPDTAMDEHGLRSALYGSTGFMLIKRQVLVEMAKAYPELKYNYSYASTYDHMYDNFAFFDTMIDSETGDYLPEDYAFCRRWTCLGKEVHVDMLSKFMHVGSRIFSGDYPAFLSRRAKNG